MTVSEDVRAAVVLLFSLLATPAAAQSFYLGEGALEVGGTVVGSATRAPMASVRGSGTRARIRFDGQALSLEAEIDLATAHLQVGVGADAPVTHARFRARVRAGTWAPVVALNARAVRIALPPGAPAHGAWLALGATPATGIPSSLPRASTTDIEADDDEWLCTGSALAPRRGEPAAWLPPVDAFRRRTSSHGGWDTIEVELGGFVFVGYRRTAAPCTGRDESSGGFQMRTRLAWRRPRAHGRAPAGTPLYASDTATTPFAELRAETFGIPPSRSSSEHAAPRWLVLVDDPSGARFVLDAWVREAETPADARDDPQAPYASD